MSTKQLSLFSTATPKLTSKGLTGTGPAPRGDRSWLKAFIGPETWALIQTPPVVKHRRRSA
jgi:hypothetical protein